MAQAAPAAGAFSRTDLPDILSARTHRMVHWTVPVALALVYGYWVAAIRRDGGPITGWNVLFGFVSAIVFAVLMLAVLQLTPSLPRETHAVVWFAFTGITFGFAYSQTGATVLRSVIMSIGIALLVGIPLFYWYYTHEDGEGHHVP
ncbi:hypothetical protein [Streptomyces mangrovisoli]|uniref:Uncharacterized protein n=1 Tax=Streptomyces mangrovisoli TaxID=1428628 RepID=A0A1J4P4S7_9ACTN|nr:hypothetical protein [Streptomyces mangrovisoli]OIJ69576.1 hypothetical protein WN71_001445 [Streptomyces mangrovisoli]